MIQRINKSTPLSFVRDNNYRGKYGVALQHQYTKEVITFPLLRDNGNSMYIELYDEGFENLQDGEYYVLVFENPYQLLFDVEANEKTGQALKLVTNNEGYITFAEYTIVDGYSQNEYLYPIFTDILRVGIMGFNDVVEVDGKYTFIQYESIESQPLCPECPEKDCPDCPQCPDIPECPDCPQCPDIPECPECPECPDCPECEECPECELTTHYNNGLRFSAINAVNVDFAKMINWKNVNGDFYGAFENISSRNWDGLSYVDFDGQSVNASYGFSNTNIKNFNADILNAGEITNMYGTFFGAGQLVTFTAGSTPINGDITVAFNDCDNLTSIDFGTAESYVTGDDLLFKDNSYNRKLTTILMGNCTFNDTYYSRFSLPTTVKNITFGNKFTGQLHLKGELDDIYAEDICSKLYDFTNDPDGLGLTASATGGGSIFYNSLTINALVFAMERGWYCQRIY